MDNSQGDYAPINMEVVDGVFKGFTTDGRTEVNSGDIANEENRFKNSAQINKNIQILQGNLLAATNDKAKKSLQTELTNQQALLAGTAREQEDPYNFAGNSGNLNDSQIAAVVDTSTSPIIGKAPKLSALGVMLNNPETQKNIADAVGGMFAGAKNASQKILDANVLEQDALNKKAALQLSDGDLAANIVHEQNAQQVRQAADRFGWIADNSFNTEDVDSLARQRARSNVAISKELAVLRKDIGALQQANPLTDPLGFLFNSFEAGPKIDRFNALAAEYNLNAELSSSTSKMITEVNNANAGKTAAVSAREADMLAQQKLNKAQEDSLNTRVAAAKAEGATQKEINAIMAGATNQLLTVEGHELQRQATEENRLASEENRKANREISKERLSIAQRAELERKERIEAEKVGDKNVADSLSMVGLPKVDSEKKFKALPKPTQDLLTTLKASGGDKLGDNPDQVAEVWQMAKDNAARSQDVNTQIKAKYPPQQVELATYVQDKYNSTYSSLRTGTVAGAAKEKDAVDNANRVVSGELTTLMKDPEGKHAWNPYKVNDIGQRTSDPSQVASVFAVKAQELAGTDKKTPVSAKAVVEAIAIDESINPSDAGAQISNYFSRAVADNNTTMRFQRFAAPVQDSYIVKYSGKSYDLTQPAQSSKLILDLRMRNTAYDMTNSMISTLQ